MTSVATVSSTHFGDGALSIKPPTESELAELDFWSRQKRLSEYYAASWERAIAIQTFNDNIEIEARHARDEQDDTFITTQRVVTADKKEHKSDSSLNFSLVAAEIGGALNAAGTGIQNAASSFRQAADDLFTRQLPLFIETAKAVVDEFIQNSSATTLRVAHNVWARFKSAPMQPSAASPNGREPKAVPAG